MRKSILLVAVLALAAMPSVADAKKAKRHHHHAAKPAATQVAEAPGAPAGRVIAGFFRDASKVGQPVAPAKKK